MLRSWMLVVALLLAAAIPAAAGGKVRVVQHSHCVVAGGLVAGVDWDVWQEIYQPAYPIWLAPHTHRGAECIMAFTGVTSWWFQRAGPAGSPPTIVPVPAGQPLYTVSGRVHDAGNATHRTMAYLGIHVLETGSHFSYPVTDPSAPAATPMPGAVEIKHFKSAFVQQKHLDGTFTIDNRIEALPLGRSYVRPGSQTLAYYSVVRGVAIVTIGAVGARMSENTSVAIPLGSSATIASTAPNTLLAVTVILRGDCDKTPALCSRP